MTTRIVKRFEKLKELAAIKGTHWKNEIGKEPFNLRPSHYTGVYNPPSQKDPNIRWIENVSTMLRKVGYADDICQSINHKGWYADEYGDSIYRGIVYRLPAREGKSLFVYGYADPWNDDCALLDFDYTDCEKDAALKADSMAERYAEEEKDYRIQESAESRIEDIQGELKDIRGRIISILRERRKACAAGLNSYGVLADAIKGQVKSLLRDRHKLAAERQRLERDPYSLYY